MMVTIYALLFAALIITLFLAATSKEHKYKDRLPKHAHVPGQEIDANSDEYADRNNVNLGKPNGDDGNNNYIDDDVDGYDATVDIEIEENGMPKFNPRLIKLGGSNKKLKTARKSMKKATKKKKQKAKKKIGHDIDELFEAYGVSSVPSETKTSPFPFSGVIQNQILDQISAGDTKKFIGDIETTRQGDFYKIGKKCDTDKITRHGHHRYYPQFLEKYRKIPNIAMAEIGVGTFQSLCMWLEYFPHAFIYGFDISKEHESSRAKVYKLDQGNAKDVKKIKSKLSHPVFFIVDDGSHHPLHQISTFDILFRDILLPGGVYAIEDIETSYWYGFGIYGYVFDYGYRNELSAIELFKALADEVNHEYLSDTARELQDTLLAGRISKDTLSMISSITFAQNLIIISKHSKEDMQLFGNREYPFEHALGPK